MSKRKSIGAAAPRSILSSKIARWAAASAVILGFGFAGMSAASHMTAGNSQTARITPERVWKAKAASLAGDNSHVKRYLFSQSVTFTEVASGHMDANQMAAQADPFDAVKHKAGATPQSLAAIFKREADRNAKAAHKAAGHDKPVITLAEAAKERFAVASLTPSMRKKSEAIVLAYAPQGRSSAADALHMLAEQDAENAPEIASLPAEDEIIDAPVPRFRPDTPIKPGKRAVTADQADDEDIRIVKPGDRAEDAPKPVARPEAKPDSKPVIAEKPDLRDKSRQRLASVATQDKKPEKSGGSLGWSFRSLFGNGGSTTAQAGRGVAVYDISAKKVYMPDGTVLAAYSGIGKMANNPKYAHVKMNGPTPPHTYNLRMREKRFHGVEAIRMLPVDGKNKYGRDGFLTHTQLLRGRQGQSHGCVAFADYDKFLNAFKQGKVKQMVVVASGGRAAAAQQMARN